MCKWESLAGFVIWKIMHSPRNTYVLMFLNFVRHYLLQVNLSKFWKKLYLQKNVNMCIYLLYYGII